MVVEGPAAALADVAVDPEAHPVAAALEVAEEPKAVALSVESAALVVVPMGCPAVVIPRALMGHTVCLGHQLPKDVRLNSSPSADDPEDLQAAVPASASQERVALETHAA